MVSTKDELVDGVDFAIEKCIHTETDSGVNGNIKTSWKQGSGELRWIHTDLLCERDSRGTKMAEKQHKKKKKKR